LELTTGAGNIL
jgi:hypothetical protein